MSVISYMSGHHCHHDHGHHHHGTGLHDHDLHGASRRSLTGALVLITGYMVVEIVGGILSGSLSLIADAGHMLTDAASIALALIALYFSHWPASAERTFGYRRLETLAALLNALTLWLIAGGVLIEAYRRFGTVPDIKGDLMLSVGAVGLVVNILAALILHRSARHSINVEGAFQHVIADLLGSIGVVVSGVLVWAFGWTLADPILSVLIALLILFSTWRLLAKVIQVLLQGVPQHIDVQELCDTMEAVPGVTLVHDIHVWALAPDYNVLTAHVLVDPESQPDDLRFLRKQLQTIATRDFHLQHITIQLEFSAAGCVEENHNDFLVRAARPPQPRLTPIADRVYDG